MKRSFVSLLVAIMAVGCTADLNEENVVNNSIEGKAAPIVCLSQDVVEGEMLVRFDESSTRTLAQVASCAGATRSGVEGVDAILESVGATLVEPVFNITEKNSAAVHAAGLHLWYRFVFDSSANLESVAEALSKVGEVQTVQYNSRVKKTFNRPAVPYEKVEQTEAVVSRASEEFDDPMFANQWHYVNTGNTSITTPIKEGCDVNCAQAWRLCTGDPSIIVAVLDEGVMHSHEDLNANMWVNTAEQNGSSGKDDDSNGYKDDIYGYNFVASNGTISWTKADDSGHGTHVAGTIAAVNNNGKGVCGIAGGSGNNDGVRIMTCQIFSGESGASTSNTAKAIQYAADNGAVILQCSWGYDSGAYKNEYKFNASLSVEKNAIDYFIANAGSETGPIKGGLAIFAAGNEYAAMPGYPGAYEPCVSVAALSADYTPASYTNYGPGTDICAPGGDSDYAKSSKGTILSTLTPNVSSASKPYGYMEGTSMACPHVSGVAALGLSYAAKRGKHFTAREFRDMLLTSVSEINSYMTGTKTYYYYYEYYGTSYKKSMNLNNYKSKMGSGYADAYRLMLAVDGTPWITIPTGTVTTVNLETIFGGDTGLQVKSIDIPTIDKAAVDMVGSSSSGANIAFECRKAGVASVTVTVLVGGTITSTGSNASGPVATEVSRTFTLVVREGGMASNGGWL